MLIITDKETVQVQKQHISKIVVKDGGIEIRMGGNIMGGKNIMIFFNDDTEIGNIIYDSIISAILSSDEVCDLRKINNGNCSIW